MDSLQPSLQCVPIEISENHCYFTNHDITGVFRRRRSLFGVNQKLVSHRDIFVSSEGAAFESFSILTGY